MGTAPDDGHNGARVLKQGFRVCDLSTTAAFDTLSHLVDADAALLVTSNFTHPGASRKTPIPGSGKARFCVHVRVRYGISPFALRLRCELRRTSIFQEAASARDFEHGGQLLAQVGDRAVGVPPAEGAGELTQVEPDGRGVDP